jgi:hypothetical protein
MTRPIPLPHQHGSRLEQVGLLPENPIAAIANGKDYSVIRRMIRCGGRNRQARICAKHADRRKPAGPAQRSISGLGW